VLHGHKLMTFCPGAPEGIVQCMFQVFAQHS
jgi:hypothetical protein